MNTAIPSATPDQIKRLDLGLRRLDNVVDGLGHPIDKGIAPAVAMLSALGINTSQSCEGHDDWATGGPYIDVSAPGYRSMKASYQTYADTGAPSAQLEAMRGHIRAMNACEDRKLIPILTAFYAGRDVDYATRIGLTQYGMCITRIESVGVLFQEVQADPAAKHENLVKYQAEMNAFTEFLIRYAPSQSAGGT
jgi:hypothetical protein